MKEQLIDDDLARKFLLGQVSPEQRGELEELAFEDPDTFSLLESVEDDLIDEYLQGELSAVENERFQTHFLSQPGRRANLKLSRVIQHHLNEEDVPAVVPDVPVVVPDDRVSVLGLFKLSRPVFRLSLVAAILIGLVIAIWLYVRVLETQRPPAFEARKEENATPTPSITNSPTVEPSPTVAHGENKNSAPSPPKHETPPVYAELLLPLTVNRSGAQSFTPPSKGANVSVALALINETRYNRYDATLQSDDGTVLKSWPNLRARRLKSVDGLLINIPVALLKPQQLYRIIVTGRAADGTVHNVPRYEFQVTPHP